MGIGKYLWEWNDSKDGALICPEFWIYVDTLSMETDDYCDRILYDVLVQSKFENSNGGIRDIFRRTRLRHEFLSWNVNTNSWSNHEKKGNHVVGDCDTVNLMEL